MCWEPQPRGRIKEHFFSSNFPASINVPKPFVGKEIFVLRKLRTKIRNFIIHSSDASMPRTSPSTSVGFACLLVVVTIPETSTSANNVSDRFKGSLRNVSHPATKCHGHGSSQPCLQLTFRTRLPFWQRTNPGGRRSPASSPESGTCRVQS